MARLLKFTPQFLKFPGWGDPEFQLRALLVLALLVGGGGSAYGVFNLLVQLASLLILGANPKLVLDFFRQGPKLFRFLVAVTLALPLLQLVPLPPFLWSVLPGRDLLGQSLSLIGRSSDWFPISLAPSRTLTAFLSLLPVLAVLVLSSNLSHQGWVRVWQAIVFVGVVSAVLGGLQLITANEHFIIFRERTNSGMLYASFANHNATGLFFVLALTAVATLQIAFERPRSSLWWLGVAATIFVIAVVLSQSRSSIGLLSINIAIISALILQRSKMIQAHKLATVFIGVMLCAGALLAVQKVGRFSRSFERFESIEDVRPAIWSDTLLSVKRFWPVGSGISSFPEVFEVDETLENVWLFHAGRAHNDYLEIAQEAGIVGLLLIVAWMFWCGSAWRSAWNGGSGRKATIAVAGLLVISLQSMVDYPLRNQTILCVAALFLALLLDSCRKRLARGNL